MRRNEMNWPEKLTSLFQMQGSGYGSPTWCSIQWINDGNYDAGRLANEFKRAGDKIVYSLSEDNDPFHPDGLFIPVAYLYRHCLELKLKDLLSLMVHCRFVDNDGNVRDALEKHNLAKLWNLVKPGLRKRWPDGDRKVLANTEAVILDFHKVDKSGQNLRYCQDKNGNSTSAHYPRSIDLAQLQKAFEGIYNLLDGCTMMFRDLLDFRGEMEREYSGYE
ncbi:MAG: hypothetical protein ACYS8Y_10980 [Planctomycetota bacterium]